MCSKYNNHSWFDFQHNQEDPWDRLKSLKKISTLNSNVSSVSNLIAMLETTTFMIHNH